MIGWIVACIIEGVVALAFVGALYWLSTHGKED